MDVAGELRSALARHRVGELDAAETGYRQIVDNAEHLGELDQENLTEALHLLGAVILQRGQPRDAAVFIERAISRDNLNAHSHNNLGNAQLALGKVEMALASYWRAVELEPTLFDAHFNRATALLQAHRPSEAEASLKRAVELQPRNSDAWCNLGLALRAQRRLVPAREAFEEAIQLRPTFAEAHANLGAVWRELGNLSSAETALRLALRHDPTLGEAHINLGDAFVDANDYSRAIDSYRASLAHKPSLSQARTKLIAARLMICDWANIDALRNRFSTLDSNALSIALPSSNGPFVSLMLGLPMHSQRHLADSWATKIGRRTSAYPRRDIPDRPMHGILRVGYLSDDFRDHPVGHIMHGLFALHDRAQVSVHVYSTGRDDGSDYRRSAEHDADQFRDISQSSHAVAADIIATDGIDLLVNLQGLTAGARSEILALRPAPIQISWLGYPSTMGKSLVDYIVCDYTAAPPEIESDFSEAAVMLPNCYIPTYSETGLSTQAGSRAEHGLPDDATVFCCFNAPYKIEPAIFECWMNILRRTPNAVLWLRGGQAESALKNAARKSGIDENRLIFTRNRLERSAHIARHRLADLFLDTYYYNAHAPALDALTAGLPILCCPGPSLAGHATASMLATLGLNDMVLPDLAAYEDAAAQLAADRFVGLKDRLIAARESSPFFDRELFVRHLEAAFRMMADRATSGQPPERIEVSPLSRTTPSKQKQSEL
jgi:protein O-GlcNAc transferase